jgi:acyl-CoA synthetase (NDP forming)
MHLNVEKTKTLLKKYKISVPQTQCFRGKLPKNIKYPIVLKVDSPLILHKTEFGAVIVNIKNEAELKEKIILLEKNLKAKKIQKYDFVAQEMVKGVELIIGIKSDQTFGKVVVFGLGGIFVEVMKDVSMRIAPLSRKDCEEMIDEIKGKKLLEGYRNMPAVNKEKLVELLMKTSKIAVNEKNILELDFNPVMANENRAYAVDARIIMGDKNA